MEVSTLWGLIPTAIAIWLFIRDYKNSAKEEDSEDIKQNLELLKLQGEVSVLKSELANLKEQVQNNKLDTSREFVKIETKLDEIIKHIINLNK